MLQPIYIISSEATLQQFLMPALILRLDTPPIVALSAYWLPTTGSTKHLTMKHLPTTLTCESGETNV